MLHVLSVYLLFNYILVGVFYYIIGNVEPKLRSSLKNIQLIACVTEPILKEYGFGKVLQPFIQDANKLSNVSNCITMCAVFEVLCTSRLLYTI